MKKYITKLNIVFLIQLAIVILAVLGVLPRSAILFSGGLLVVFVLISSIEESVFLIARSIPIFTALPLMGNFDSFNIWRIIVLIVFIKWVSRYDALKKITRAFSLIVGKSKINVRMAIYFAYANWRMEFLCALLLIISLLSLAKADDIFIGVKRIIYFMNLGMLFFVVRSVVDKKNLPKISSNVLLSGVLVVFIGVIQLGLAYYMSVDNFSEFWALKAQKTLYGAGWANIAIVANTWFAYYNETIHLRMFSSFPDTHSFPIYLLMVICFSVFSFFNSQAKNIKIAISILVIFSVWELILSGTRGIWAAALFPALIISYLFFKKRLDARATLSVAVTLLLFLFFLPLSSVIFNSNQFALHGGLSAERVFSERIKSIIDTNEVSNRGRIYIWKETIKSMVKNPFLGVGIANFPTILKQNPTAIKAGSSAHNLYLNFFAELGVFGFIVTTLIIWEVLRNGWKLFNNKEFAIWFFGLNFILYFTWILWYSMTDVAIFDERAFLLIMILVGSVFALSTKEPSVV